MISSVLAWVVALSGCDGDAVSGDDAPVQRFVSALDNLKGSVAVPLSELQQVNPVLLRPTSLYPDFKTYSSAELTQIFQAYRLCQPYAGDPALQQFMQAVCQRQPLPDSWFAGHLLFPLGGSYAQQYLRVFPQDAPRLQPYLHLRERAAALGGLGGLSDDNLDKLADGQRWLLDKGVIWRLREGIWLHYPPTGWQPLAQQAGVVLSIDGEQCHWTLGALCINPKPPSPWGWLIILGILPLIILGALSYVVWQKRQIKQRHRFVLQMLSHELRTPIASLTNVVELFRQDFNALPSTSQSTFALLADGVQHMRQITEASKQYLSASGEAGELGQPTPARLSDWLTHVVQPFPAVTYCLEQDARVALPFYWLSVCVQNLLDNAHKYGKPPVRLSVSLSQGWLKIRVSDGGALPQRSLARMKSNARSSGMGLGLLIVQRLMQHYQGKVRLSGPDTTFTLEIPYGHCAEE